MISLGFFISGAIYRSWYRMITKSELMHETALHVNFLGCLRAYSSKHGVILGNRSRKPKSKCKVEY